MIGRRVRDLEPHQFEAGDYGFWVRGNCWCAETPNGHSANLAAHSVTEHEDGTITASPSIEVSTSRPDGSGDMKIMQVFHGYLERGVWRDA